MYVHRHMYLRTRSAPAFRIRDDSRKYSQTRIPAHREIWSSCADRFTMFFNFFYNFRKCSSRNHRRFLVYGSPTCSLVMRSGWRIRPTHCRLAGSIHIFLVIYTSLMTTLSSCTYRQLSKNRRNPKLLPWSEEPAQVPARCPVVSTISYDLNANPSNYNPNEHSIFNR